MPRDLADVQEPPAGILATVGLLALGVPTVLRRLGVMIVGATNLAGSGFGEIVHIRGIVKRRNSVSLSLPTSMSAKIVVWGLQDKGGVNLEDCLYGTVLYLNHEDFHCSNSLLHVVENRPMVFRNLLCCDVVSAQVSSDHPCWQRSRVRFPIPVLCNSSPHWLFGRGADAANVHRHLALKEDINAVSHVKILQCLSTVGSASQKLIQEWFHLGDNFCELRCIQNS